VERDRAGISYPGYRLPACRRGSPPSERRREEGRAERGPQGEKKGVLLAGAVCMCVSPGITFIPCHLSPHSPSRRAAGCLDPRTQ